VCCCCCAADGVALVVSAFGVDGDIAFALIEGGADGTALPAVGAARVLCECAALRPAPSVCARVCVCDVCVCL
jgi:hypothetical protein